MFRVSLAGLRSTAAIAAASAATIAAPAAQATPWNAAAVYAAWKFGAEVDLAACAKVANAAPASAAPMSALDRIRMQQAGLNAGDQPVAVNAPFYMPKIALHTERGAVLEPAAAGFGCAPVASSAGYVAAYPQRYSAGKSGGDFLASKIVPIARTSFDAAWARVSRSGAGKANVRAAALAAGADASPRERVAAVNRWVNARVTFTDDSRNYGKRDYWASASETLGRGKGDCEDYAIAKMQILAEMGVAREDMYLTLARDKVRRLDHAVLVVKIDGQPLVLDNGTDALLDGRVANDYRPVYSFSADRRFLHGF